MHPRRLARINEQILQVVSQTALELKDPGIGFVTFTGAKVSPDVSIARIYYSVLGTPEEKEKTAVALERARPYIRGEMARLENLRRVPNILFVYDDGAEKADRVNRILHKIHKEDPDVSDAPAD
jgi:ribosome-binding factor A